MDKIASKANKGPKTNIYNIRNNIICTRNMYMFQKILYIIFQEFIQILPLIFDATK